MSRKKPIKFYYLSLSATDDTGEDVLLDLTGMFDRFSTEYAVQDNQFRYIFKIQGTNYKLDKIKKPVGTNDYYHLVIEKLRDFDLPSRSKRFGNSQGLGLKEDEFLGEKVSILYDYINHIFMFQINKNGITISRLELWFSSLLQSSDYIYDIRLPTIVSRDAISEVRSMIGYKALNVKLDVNFNQNGFINNLFSIISPKFDQSSSQDYDLELKLVARKDQSDNEFLPDTIIHEVLTYDINDTIKKIEIKGRDLNQAIDTVNLLENKIMSIIKFRYEADRTLNPVSVFEAMVIEYNDSGKDLCLNNRVQQLPAITSNLE